MAKKLFIIIVLLSLIGFPAFAAHNCDINDYDTTVSGATETRLSFSYDKDYTLRGENGHSDVTSNFDIYHSRFYDSYNNSWSYGAEVTHRDNYSSPLFSGANQNAADMHADYLIYFMPKESIFHGAGFEYNINNAIGENGPTDERYTLSGTYYIGYGHFIDLTPMAEAGNLEDRLMEAGALKSRLSKATLLKLAELINKYRMGEYNYNNMDTAKGRFLQDITDVLEKSGKLNGPLGGFSFWRISENRTVNFTRFKGLQISMALGEDCQKRVSDVADSKDNSYDINNYLGLYISNSWVIDWLSQLWFNSSYKCRLNNNKGVFPAHEFSSLLVYSYDLTNTLWLTLGVQYYSRDWESKALTDPDTYTILASSINYKIEDFYAIQFTYSRRYYNTGTSSDQLMLTNNIYMN